MTNTLLINKENKIKESYYKRVKFVTITMQRYGFKLLLQRFKCKKTLKAT